MRYALALSSFVLLVAPMAADAQGLVGGAERGYNAGDRALGPVGGIVGGAVGAGVGTVNGALGIRPGYYRHRYGPHCIFRFGHRYCR